MSPEFLNRNLTFNLSGHQPNTLFTHLFFQVQLNAIGPYMRLKPLKNLRAPTFLGIK